MQFGCESCKAQLQIADEKVRGKRLIVRCKRCGAKIALADPALSNSSPRLVVVPASAPGPVRLVPRPGPAPERPATDDESTRAMDSDLLERALRASRADAAQQNGAPPTQKLHITGPGQCSVWVGGAPFCCASSALEARRARSSRSLSIARVLSSSVAGRSGAGPGRGTRRTGPGADAGTTTRRGEEFERAGSARAIFAPHRLQRTISRFPRTCSSAICSCALQLSQPNCIRAGLYLKSQGGQEGKGGRPPSQARPMRFLGAYA